MIYKDNTKICTRCGLKKDIGEFRKANFSKANSDGYLPECRVCNSTRMKAKNRSFTGHLRKAYNNTMMTALLSTLISAIIFQYLFFKIFEIKIVMVLVIILFLLVISLKKPFNYPILLSIPLIVYVLYNIFLTEYPINTYFPLFTHMTVSIAYTFLGIYIINDNLLLSMGKIGKTMIHLVVSIILNFAIGFYFASINIFYTPIGLFISSLTLNILSTKLVKNIMKNIDNIYIF